MNHTQQNEGLPVKIVAIGDELLEGCTADTNSRRIQRALGRHAVQCELIQVVPDSGAAIGAALDRTNPGDLVFVTGGLGSTPDDITRDEVARWAGVELIEDPEVRAGLEARWRQRGVRIRPGGERQCQVPDGLQALKNPIGSAPGLVGPLGDRTLVLLPGVPGELAGLLPLVVARLAESGQLPPARALRIWRTAQISELALVHRCADIRRLYADLQWSWWLTDWGVDLRVAAAAGRDERLDTVAEAVDCELGRVVYERGAATLPEIVQERLLARGRTVSVAESCTGGLIGGALTETPGSSGIFRGGFLTYADEAKISQLGVPADVLAAHGAVSEATVLAMAAGCRTRLDTDYGLAVSGVSGPGGGSREKPVGTTWVAVATPQAVYAACYRFPADRHRNRLLTVAAAVDSLRRVLQFGDDCGPWRDGDTWCRT